MARPTSLTPDVQRRIVGAILAGNFQETAAGVGGINAGTLHRWLVRGREEEERLAAHPDRKRRASETPFREFREAVTRARAEVEAGHVAQLQRAAGGETVIERRTIVHSDGREEIVERFAPADWRASAWWLERSFPAHWGRRAHSSATGGASLAPGGPIDRDVRVAELLERARRLQPAIRKPQPGPGSEGGDQAVEHLRPLRLPCAGAHLVHIAPQKDDKQRAPVNR